MYSMELMGRFLMAAKDDPRIGPVHISLYVSLMLLGQKLGQTPLCVFSHQIMPFCKISGSATYHKAIRELHAYGYITYLPSYNHFTGSQIFFVDRDNDRKL